MIRECLKQIPFHTFLVVPFLVLFLYARNRSEVEPVMTVRVLIVGLMFSLLLFGSFYLLLRNGMKAGVLASCLMLMLFQYGGIYDFLESLYYQGLWPLKNIHRYLIILYALLCAALIWFMRRSGREFIRLNYFLNVLLFLLLVFNGLKALLDRQNETEISGSEQLTEKIFFDDRSSRPDIYYLILDGYGGGRELKKYFGFDNSEFETVLKRNGFKFSDSAFANYYYTQGSLAATLNMNYYQDIKKLQSMIRYNKVFSILKDNGYRTYNLYSGYSVTHDFRRSDSTLYIDGPNEFEQGFLKYTIFRLDDFLGLLAFQRLNSQLDKMNVFPRLSASPKFSFIHLVAPHPPYVFDRLGNIRTRHNFAEHSWEPGEYYIDQLVYLNGRVIQFIKDIVATDPSAIIVLQSDHGPWISGGAVDVFNARSGILYAYRVPGDFTIEQRTSPVNTFRYIFNGIFGAALDTLPDLEAGKTELLKAPVFLKKVRVKGGPGSSLVR